MTLSINIECHYAARRIFYCYAECLYAECHYAECLYAKCHSAECRYVKRRGTIRVSTRPSSNNKLSTCL